MEAMVQYDDWLDGINTNIATTAGSAANIPRVVAVAVVRSAVRDFLTDTDCWVHRAKALTKSADSRVMLLPRDTFICKVHELRCWPLFSDRLSHVHPNIINIHNLRENENNHEALNNLDVSLSVTQDSLECPSFIYDRYYDGILSGALASLQAMPGKAWSAPNMVSYHEQKFEEFKRKARSDSATGFNRKREYHDIRPSFI